MAPRLSVTASLRVVRGRPESSGGEPRCGASAGFVRPRSGRLPRAGRLLRKLRHRASRVLARRVSTRTSPGLRARSTNRVLAALGSPPPARVTPLRPRGTKRIAPVRAAAFPEEHSGSLRRPGSAAPFTRRSTPRSGLRPIRMIGCARGGAWQSGLGQRPPPLSPDTVPVRRRIVPDGGKTEPGGVEHEHGGVAT